MLHTPPESETETSGVQRATVSQLLDHVEAAVSDISAQRVLDPALLNKILTLVTQLRQKATNLEEIEEALDAIRSEILSPVQEELRIARVFSKRGLRIGLIGIVVSAMAALSTALFTLWPDNSNTPRLPPLELPLPQTSSAGLLLVAPVNGSSSFKSGISVQAIRRHKPDSMASLDVVFQATNRVVSIRDFKLDGARYTFRNTELNCTIRVSFPSSEELRSMERLPILLLFEDYQGHCIVRSVL